MGLNVATISAN